MRNRKRIPSSLGEAISLCMEVAEKNRRPAKVISDLMGVELKTLYRWLSEDSMPLNRLRQFETFCNAHFISDYFSTAAGRVVIEIPVGKKATETDIAEMQTGFGESVVLLSKFWQNSASLENTVAALTQTLKQVAYQRENVLKSINPELTLFGDM